MLAAGVPAEQAHPHTLRHTFGRLYMSARGAELSRLQRIMGHASPETTSRYMFHDDVELAAEHRRIERCRAIRLPVARTIGGHGRRLEAAAPPATISGASVPDLVASELVSDHPGHRDRLGPSLTAVAHVDANGGELAQLRELGHHDRAVAVWDRLAVDLQVQTVAAGDLQIDVRVVRGAHRLILDVRKVATEGYVHRNDAVALRLLDVIGDEGLQRAVPVLFELALDEVGAAAGAGWVVGDADAPLMRWP